ncbi:MAG: hypothetical protein CVV27_00505 [Candidatus Melainabacteria bacterium HGW-Melainabacteria-1]|nr:MAG: hypothetical protein CVV27_00505 [Candidatus Melainabacteria bacterium HGW-Melainabacteria-1]
MSQQEKQEGLQIDYPETDPKAPMMGTPFESRGKTLIPVAAAGATGWLSRLTFWKPNSARPMGFLVVSRNHTRFVKVQDRRWLLLGLILGALALLLLIAGIGLKVQKSRSRKPALW